MSKYKIALFIGRFQPFHKGHLYGLERCLEVAEQVIIGIGSSNIALTDDNPYNEDLRKDMIYKVIEKYIDREKVVDVIAIKDVPSDEEWVREVQLAVANLQFRKGEVVVVSNNDWVIKLLKQAGFPIHQTGLYNRDELEGVKIRKLMREGDNKWRSRVPEEVAREIDVSAAV